MADETKSKSLLSNVMPTVIQILVIIVVFYWLSGIESNSFELGRAVGRAESSMQCTQTVIDSLKVIPKIPQTQTTPKPDAQKQSL